MTVRHFVAGACVAACLVPAASSAATVAVTINNYAFSPKMVVVHPGDSVVWTNKDDVAHTVTALGGGFDSGSLDPGKMYRFALTKAGTYAYKCAIHPEMRATIVVKPAN